MAKKTPNPTDKHVGNRVRMRRMILQMSQEKLGLALGLTFQQVQKYEKGTNRIGASRLSAIASILGVTVGYFFEGLATTGGCLKLDDADDPLTILGTTREGIALAQAFNSITEPKLRVALLEIVQLSTSIANPRDAQKAA